MMARTIARVMIIALIFLFVGVAGAAAVFEYVPNPGSAPAVYDDFRWSSTSNGFWHLNPVGGKAQVANSLLSLSGANIELDHRLQTDPRETILVAKIRGIRFHKFSLGMGLFHSGTIGMELDNDGPKCGRNSATGWAVDYMIVWKKPLVGKWFYLVVDAVNPYGPKSHINPVEEKPATLTCSIYDSTGKLLSLDVARHPPPTMHYAAIDQVFLRTWDSGNNYQIDWLYAGPVSGLPSRDHLKIRGKHLS